MRLPIAGAASFAPEATEPATSLREPLRAACANAPRRLNRIIELSLIGAHRCVAGRPLAPDTAIYLACTHGTVADIVTLVDAVCRGTPVMPVTFINLSSNMAGFYVASTLGLHSGNHVGSANEVPFEATLDLARSHHTPFLLGAVEECSWPLDAHRQRLGVAPGTPLLEASHWLWIDPSAAAPIAFIDSLERFPDSASLVAYLRAQRPSANCAVSISGASPEVAAAVHAAAGLSAAPLAEPAGYTGMPTAQKCLDFVRNGRGELLQLSATAAGAWYAMKLSRAS